MSLRPRIVVPLQRKKLASFFEFVFFSGFKAALFRAVFIFCLSFGGFFGCATKPMSETKTAAKVTGPAFGQWRGSGSASRTITNDKGTKQENWSVNLEVVSRTPGYGRIEVTGAMGVYGGTIAWTPKETRILLPGQRKFVVAPNSARAFMAILPFPISPSEVEAILFDRDFDARALKSRGVGCRPMGSVGRDAKEPGREVCASAQGFALERTRGSDNVAFEVSTEEGGRVKMALKPVQSKVQERDELWALEAPRGFKLIQQ